MNWLVEVSRRIRACDAPHELTDKLVLHVITLSNICDRHMPQAPPPQVEMPIGEELEGSVEVSWMWKEQERSLSVSVDADGTALTMLDKGRALDIAQPSYEELQTAVTSFFDGWVPRG